MGDGVLAGMFIIDAGILMLICAGGDADGLKRTTIGNARVVEIAKDEYVPKVYKYTSNGYYDVLIVRDMDSWVIKLVLKPFDKPFVKTFEEEFFKKHVEEPRVFAAELNGKLVGWLELGYSSWNNTMRVWEFSVEESLRRKGLGTLLMTHAVNVAKQRGARMLVLETQSCNVPAINFYLKFGFELIGLDAVAYSNEDIERKEVRLEFGYKL